MSRFTCRFVNVGDQGWRLGESGHHCHIPTGVFILRKLDRASAYVIVWFDASNDPRYPRALR